MLSHHNLTLRRAVATLITVGVTTSGFTIGLGSSAQAATPETSSVPAEKPINVAQPASAFAVVLAERSKTGTHKHRGRHSTKKHTKHHSKKHHQAKAHHHHGAGTSGEESRADKVLSIAKSKYGTPYRYGADGPGAFDCSGFTKWVFARVGKDLPRTSAAQAGATRRVSHPEPGDLVFFGGSHVYHVGIYAGGGSIIHAPYTGAVVRKEHIWESVFYGRVR